MKNTKENQTALLQESCKKKLTKNYVVLALIALTHLIAEHQEYTENRCHSTDFPDMRIHYEFSDRDNPDLCVGFRSNYTERMNPKGYSCCELDDGEPVAGFRFFCRGEDGDSADILIDESGKVISSDCEEEFREAIVLFLDSTMKALMTEGNLKYSI